MKLFVARSHYVEGDGRLTVDYESYSYCAVFAENRAEAGEKIARAKLADVESVEEIDSPLPVAEFLKKFGDKFGVRVIV
jgi:hypothetical protein